ncbi:uncharacterized protein [Solanum tuberosum]|uniref:uncharacterized protein n=1 Tax=Solanum tuberosum TaxID=4113 RepID=UPI00073A3A74|nr:PREDICTED: uncharacterized protein LOC107062637 [Solanum tuberosum]
MSGWLLCDFCKGQKTNVKSETNKIYRRCPSCRAVSGYLLCSKCKVFKCVTFPNDEDVCIRQLVAYMQDLHSFHRR